MSVLDVVNRYYDAWINKNGDFSDVPLADDFKFVGPVASFDDADGFRAMAAQAGAAVMKFSVREQFVNGDTARDEVARGTLGYALLVARRNS